MIPEQRREELVNMSDDGVTLEGSPCHVAGWKCPDYASLSPDFGGFWRASWETVDRVLSSDDKNFLARDVTFVSWQWIGLGNEVPDALKHYCGRR